MVPGRFLTRVCLFALATGQAACDGGPQETCEAALEACGSVDVAGYCTKFPGACTGVVSQDGRIHLPAGTTASVDLTSAQLTMTDIYFSWVELPQFSVDPASFSFWLDGVPGYVETVDYYMFRGHVGAPRKFEVRWIGDFKHSEVTANFVLHDPVCEEDAQQGACADGI